MNSNAGSAFSYIPSHGTLPANGTVDIKIKYKPDRIGERFFEKIKVHVIITRYRFSSKNQLNIFT